MKIVHKLVTLFLCLQCLSLSAQEISGRVLDGQSGEPIPYASIVYGKNKGVISNDEGRFSIHSEAAIDSLVIASLGYESLHLEVLPNQTDIRLKPQTTELQEVYLSDKKISAKEIIKKAKERVEGNYDFGMAHKRFFLRKSDHQKIKELKIEVEESSIEGIDQQLMDEIVASMPPESGSYKEVLGDLYGNFELQKVSVQKAANLFNDSANERLDELTDEFEKIFRENVKESSFLKIRSGLIGVKVNGGEFNEDITKAPEAKEPTPEEKEAAANKKRDFLLKGTERDVKRLVGGMFWKEDMTIDFFDKMRKYDFSLDGYAQLEGNTVYVINFEPKWRADFRGKIYVNAEDYGVHRLEYENVKPLFKFGLFGIKTADDLYRGRMIFSRDSLGKYVPQYLEQQLGTSFSVDRPLKIIEKNRVVPGRNKQNELDTEIKFGMNEVTTYQFFVYESQPLAETDFEKLERSTDFDYESFQEYNAEYWEGTNIIEPNAAIQEFTSLRP